MVLGLLVAMYLDNEMLVERLKYILDEVEDELEQHEEAAPIFEELEVLEKLMI